MSFLSLIHFNNFFTYLVQWCLTSYFIYPSYILHPLTVNILKLFQVIYLPTLRFKYLLHTSPTCSRYGLFNVVLYVFFIVPVVCTLVNIYSFCTCRFHVHVREFIHHAYMQIGTKLVIGLMKENRRRNSNISSCVLDVFIKQNWLSVRHFHALFYKRLYLLIFLRCIYLLLICSKFHFSNIFQYCSVYKIFIY